MGKYGEVAVKAVKLFIENSEYSPNDAWQIAAKEVFGNTISLIEKSRPRSAFLGLCGKGLVNGIPSGKYTRSEKNRTYATAGLEILQSNPNLSEKEIWTRIFVGKPVKTYNHQIDVVIELFKQGYLKKTG